MHVCVGVHMLVWVCLCACGPDRVQLFVARSLAAPSGTEHRVNTPGMSFHSISPWTRLLASGNQLSPSDTTWAALLSPRRERLSREDAGVQSRRCRCCWAPSHPSPAPRFPGRTAGGAPRGWLTRPGLPRWPRQVGLESGLPPHAHSLPLRHALLLFCVSSALSLAVTAPHLNSAKGLK